MNVFFYVVVGLKKWMFLEVCFYKLRKDPKFVCVCVCVWCIKLFLWTGSTQWCVCVCESFYQAHTILIGPPYTWVATSSRDIYIKWYESSCIWKFLILITGIWFCTKILAIFTMFLFFKMFLHSVGEGMHFKRNPDGKKITFGSALSKSQSGLCRQTATPPFYWLSFTPHHHTVTTLTCPEADLRFAYKSSP